MKTQFLPRSSFLMKNGKMVNGPTSRSKRAWRKQRERKEERGRQITCSPFNLFRSYPLPERAVQLKLAQKFHEKRRSKKHLESLYEVLAPGSNTMKISPTMSTIKEPEKLVFTVRNSDGETRQSIESQTPLRAQADCHGPRSREQSVEERIQSHVKKFTRKIKADKKVKHRKHRTRVSYTNWNKAHATRGCIPKLPNFLAISNQIVYKKEGKLTIPSTDAPSTALQQVSSAKTDPTADTRSSGRTIWSQPYYGLSETSLD